MLTLQGMAECAEIEGDFSVVHDLLGLRGGIPRPEQISLLQHGTLLANNSFDIDLIRVGIEDLSDVDSRIDGAIQRARELYATVDIGIRRVWHSQITRNEADGLDTIFSKKDGRKLRRRWRGPHNFAIDVFIVRQYQLDTSDLGGICMINTSCNKNLRVADGCIIGWSGPSGFGGGLLAHEMGHGLGLHHVTNEDNVMHPSSPHREGFVESQASTMREHCFMRPGCG
jgi:hypothetical protein